jgi:hypothetical protein
MTKYRVLLEDIANKELEPFGVAYERNGGIFLFVPAWRGQKRLDSKKIEDLSDKHFPSESRYQWSKVHTYEWKLKHPIDILHSWVSHNKPAGVSNFPTIDGLVRHLQKLKGFPEDVLRETTIFTVRKITFKENNKVLHDKLRLSIGVPPKRSLKHKEEKSHRIQVEETVATAIREIVEKQLFQGNTAKIALSLANALGKPDSGRLDETVKTLEHLLSETESLELRVLLAFCYRKRGSVDDAEEQLQKALEIIRQMKKAVL